VPSEDEPGARWESAGASSEGRPLRNMPDDPAGRNFRLRVTVTTPQPIAPEDQARVTEALTRSVGLKLESGDTLVFGLPIPQAAPAATALPAPPGAVAPAMASDYPGLPAAPSGFSLWLLLVLGGVGLAMVAVAMRSRSGGMAAEQRDLLVTRIRGQLKLMDESHDARG
jgi:hypothetical protein